MRTLNSLLILLTVTSHCLVSVPHSHAGTPDGDPVGHFARPHVHTHSHDDDHGSDGHKSDDHGRHHDDELENDSSLPSDESESDHDSDMAVGSDYWKDNATSPEMPDFASSLVGVDDGSSAVPPLLCQRALDCAPYARGRHKCHLYILTLSIRC